MITQILDYKNVLRDLPKFLNESPLKTTYIIEQAGISSPTFYRKLKNLTFTVDEVLTLAKILKPKEASLLELKESILRGKEDYKNGRVHEHQDVIDEIKKELLS